MSGPTVVSLFCGVGGLDLGFEWAGFDVTWATDISPIAAESYPLNFNREAVCADLNELPIDQIPQADIIIGGPPCQAFSLVGLRRPDDARGRLVYRFLEIIRQKRPLAFVMENVPGMAASKVGARRLTDVLSSDFASLGYSVSTLRLNSADYLVPQKRRRVVLLGTRMGEVRTPDPQGFSRFCYGVDQPSFDNSAAAAIGDLGEPVGNGQLASYGTRQPSPFANLMRMGGQDQITLHEMPRMSTTDRRLLSFIPPGGNYTAVPDEHATPRILNFKRTGGRTTTYARLHADEPSYTINTYFRRPNVGANFHYAEDRLITPREAMRFQSIPDRFRIVKAAQDMRNALIGNAVPPIMAHAIAWSLRHTLEGHAQDEIGQQRQLQFAH